MMTLKRIFSFALLLCCFSASAFAKHVDEATARQAGSGFLAYAAPSNTLTTGALSLVYQEGTGNAHAGSSAAQTVFYYVFNNGTNGFVIVAGDDNVLPVLGYSSEGAFDPNHIPTNTRKWLEGYKNQIRYVVDNGIEATPEIQAHWTACMNGYNPSSARTTAGVNPLVSTHWDQSPYYNALCPGGSVTGCVATAMAQIMKYWNYPSAGSGFHSYNHQTYGTLSANFGSTTYQWGSMPNSVNSSNSAVATLMFHCGVSVDMNYSPQSSGAYVINAMSPIQNCSEYALKTYFGYKNTLRGEIRVNYSEAQWISLLKTELNASRPVLYAGSGSGGGHAFVCDGYDNNDFFHMNWGWSGNSDGYFQVGALNPGGLGTGGGTGGFNSNQHAVVGIEPPSGNPTYNLALYDYVTPSAGTIYYGQAFNVSTNIANYGTLAFSGDYTAAVFDNQFNFIDYVQVYTGNSLPAGSAYTNNIVFSNSGLFSMLPGTYYVSIFYRPTGGNWVQVSDNGNYTNITQIDVVNPNSIEMNSAMSVTPGTTLTQGQPISVNLNVVNTGVNTFIGQYGLGLYNLDGTLAQSLAVVNETNGLPGGYTYLSPFLTFSNAAITAPPGTYLLALQHNPNNTGWQLTGSSNYQNPIRVTVQAPALSPDIYEVNNVVNQSYNLPVNFSGNSTTRNTVGSNLHVGTDNDFYKIILPTGYSYSITARVHDSYNSGNGNTYTADVLFSYSLDGVNWSAAFDDVMSGPIALANGGTVYFHVAPYFAGQTGTYLLDLSLTRSALSGSSSAQAASGLSVYPNPAYDFVRIDLSSFSGTVDQIDVLNTQGQVMSSLHPAPGETQQRIPVGGFPNGTYFLRFSSSRGVITEKLNVTH